jgi:hypothetical protein
VAGYSEDGSDCLTGGELRDRTTVIFSGIEPDGVG